MFQDHESGYSAGDGVGFDNNQPQQGIASRVAEHLLGQFRDEVLVKRCFLATVRRGSFTTAAQSLGMKPQALRNEIRLFEGQLGIRLFNSGGGRIALTDVGQQLYQLNQQSEQRHKDATATSIYGERNKLTLSIPKLVLEGFLFREFITVIRENSGLKICLVDDSPELQESADLVIWLQDPCSRNYLQRQLARPQHVSTQTFSLYLTGRRLSGCPIPERWDDLHDHMAVQYQGYERFANFAQWNDSIAQRRHGTIHVDTADAQWQMIRWANCVGLLPDKAVYLDGHVRQLPIVFDDSLELGIWVGQNKRTTHDRDAGMIAERMARALSIR